MKTKSFLLGLALMLVFAIAATLLSNSRPPSDDRAAQRISALKNLQEQNDKKLGTYAVLDRTKGTFQIPIARAMELTITELNRDRPHAVTP